MRITFVQPCMGVYQPLSIGYLAAYLADRGHKTSILDLQVPYQREHWKELLVASRPDLIGFTALSPSISQAGSLAAQAKEFLPDTKIVIGGYHATIEPELTLREYPDFDYLVMGEGEETMVELCERLQEGTMVYDMTGLAWRKGESIELGPARKRIKDIDALPRPHDFYDLEYYLDKGSFTHQYGFGCASVITSRGCPFSCRFCGIPDKYVIQSVQNVAKEIEELLRRGAEGIFFRDSTFTVKREWVLEFCEEIMQRRLRFPWVANARPDLVDEDMLCQMKKAGCFALCYGVESGRDHILEYYGKGHTVEDTRRAIASTKCVGIRIVAYFMLGAIVETRADIEASYQLARELNTDWTIWKIFIPLPGSAIYNEFKEKGISLDFDKLLTDKATVALVDMTKEEIEKRHAELSKEFTYVRDNRLRAFLRQMRRVNSPGDALRLGQRIARSVGRKITAKSFAPSKCD